MTKKQIVTTLTLATLALSQAGVSADELAVDTDASTTIERTEGKSEDVTPVEPTAPIEVPEAPTEEIPSTPENPTPEQPVEPLPTEPTVPIQPVEPSTPPSTELPTEEPKDDKVPEVPKEEVPSTPETPKVEEPDKAPKQDVEQPLGDKPKEKEPQADDPLFTKPITEPTLGQPIFSHKGDKIIGTQDSQLLVQNQDGTVQTQSAAEAGATVHSDGTVLLKDSTGEVKRLPKTGDDAAGSFAMAISGVIALFGTAFLKTKNLFR